MNRKTTYNTIALIGVLIAVIVALCSFARWNVKNFEKAIVTQTQQHLLNIAKSEAQSIEAFVGNVREELKVFAQDPRVEEAVMRNLSSSDLSNSDQYSPVVALHEHLAGKVNAIYRLDARGIIQSRVPHKQDARGKDYSNKPGVKKVLKNHKPYISEVFLSASGSHKCFSICEPVFEKEQFIGIVRAMIRLNAIHDMVKHIKVGQKGYALVVDNGGDIISHPNSVFVGQSITAMTQESDQGDEDREAEVISKMLSGDLGTGSFVFDEFEEEKVVMAWVPIRFANELWSIAVIMSYDEISGPLKAHARNLFIGVELLILALVAAGIWFYRVKKKGAQLQAQLKAAGQLQAVNRKLQSEMADHKNAQDQVKHQNEFLNSILESLTHPFYVIDANDYTIITANSTADADGISENTKCYTVSHKHDKPCDGSDDPCPLQVIKKTKLPVTLEHIHYDKFGNPRKVEVHAYPIFDANGDVAQIIEYSLDITERKEAEQRLNKTLDELTRFNKLAVGRELRMIELKNEVNRLMDELGREEKYQIDHEPVAGPTEPHKTRIDTHCHNQAPECRTNE